MRYSFRLWRLKQYVPPNRWQYYSSYFWFRKMRKLEPPKRRQHWLQPYDVRNQEENQHQHWNAVEAWHQWLNPQSRVFAAKLMVSHLLKKFSLFWGIQKFITVFVRVCQRTQSCVRWIEHYTLLLRSILILFSQLHLGFTMNPFTSRFRVKSLQVFLPFPIHSVCPVHVSSYI
jgi:hypothetical protein